MIFHIKTHSGTIRAFLINSIKISFLMLKLRKTARVLVRNVSRFFEILASKRQNDEILIVEIVLLRENHGKRSKKYGTLCGRLGPSRKTVGYGTVRTRSADKIRILFCIRFIKL